MSTIGKTPVIGNSMLNMGKRFAHDALTEKVSYITCGDSVVVIPNITKAQKAEFNNFSSQLKEWYRKLTIEGLFNPFLTEAERNQAQQSTDTEFMTQFMQGTSKIVGQAAAFEAGVKMMEAIKECFSAVGEYFKDPESIAYMKTAGEISDLKLKMISLEDDIEKTGSQMKELKSQYEAKTEEKSRIRTAKKYNTLADKYNKLVGAYNEILTGRYSSLVREQLKRRETIKKEFSDKSLFGMVYGKEGPKMPVGIK